MVNHRIIKDVAFLFFVLFLNCAVQAAGPFWNVIPSTWASGATLQYSVAMKGPRPWVDVIGSSATGNGITDDLAAIQRAISISTANGGGIVYFPPGTYLISDQIIVPSSVTLLGAGMNATIIKAKSGYPSDRDVIHLGPNESQNYSDTGGGMSIEIKEMWINAENTSGVSYGIAAFGVDFFIAEHVRISSSSSYGMIIEGSDTNFMKSPQVIGCHFLRCGRTGGSDSLGGGRNTDARYIFNTFEQCYGTAIDNVYVTRALWMGNRSINNAFGTGHMWSDFSMSDSQIVNNYLKSGSIHIFGNLGPGLGGGPDSVTIAYNHLDGPSSGAILVTPANASPSDVAVVTNLKIIGNLIENATDYAINIGDAPNCIIANNHIVNWGYNSAAINLDSGVVATIGSTQCVVSGNTGKPGNSNLWYRENSSNGQIPNNVVTGNYFPGGTVSLVTASPSTTLIQFGNGTSVFSSSFNVTGKTILNTTAMGVSSATSMGIGAPVGIDKFEIANGSATIGQSGTNNAPIGALKFGTGSTNDRYAYIQGYRGGDAATIEIRFATYNGDGDHGDRMTIGPAGGLKMGTPTGGDKGLGTINVSADIYKNNTAYTNPDYALEHWADGKVKKFKNNLGAKNYKGRLSFENLEKHMRKNYQLPGVSNASGVFARTDVVLEKLEEAYTYIIDLHHRILDAEKEITTLKKTKKE